MAKFKKVDEADFDFSRVPRKDPTYFLEKLFFTTLITGLVSFLILAPSVKPLKNHESFPAPIQYEPFYEYQDTSPTYSDYIVTPEDKKMFSDVFEYSNQNSLSFNDYLQKNNDTSTSLRPEVMNFNIQPLDQKLQPQEIKILQQNILHSDISNAHFDSKLPFKVTSKILSIEPSDKMERVKSIGNPDYDYVDLVVQKEYTQNKQNYFEQEMVSVALSHHQIVSLQTNFMVD